MFLELDTDDAEKVAGEVNNILNVPESSKLNNDTISTDNVILKEFDFTVTDIMQRVEDIGRLH